MIPRSMGSKYTHASVWMHSHRLFSVLWQIWNKLLFSNKGWQLHIRLVSTRCPNKSDIACTYSKVATKVGDTKLVAAWWNNSTCYSLLTDLSVDLLQLSALRSANMLLTSCVWPCMFCNWYFVEIADLFTLHFFPGSSEVLYRKRSTIENEERRTPKTRKRNTDHIQRKEGVVSLFNFVRSRFWAYRDRIVFRTVA